MNRVIILAAFLLSFMEIAHAQMGIRFDNCPGKEEFQNVKEFKEYGETGPARNCEKSRTRIPLSGSCDRSMELVDMEDLRN